MPAGVSWNRYLKFFAASMFSMLAGAQTVHIIYRPLEDLDIMVKQETERLKKIMEAEGKSEKVIEEVSR